MVALLALFFCLFIPSAFAGTRSGHKPQSLYWGGWIGNQLTGVEAPWDMDAVLRFEGALDKPLSIVHFAAPFASCSIWPLCVPYAFPTAELSNVRQHGAIPFLSWSSQSIPSSVDQPEFQLADLVEGKFDSYLVYFATSARIWGAPFFLRFNWEMNGDWFPWSERANGNQPGDYIAAWRHVHDIFYAVGATNATWVWCPHVDPENRLQSPRSLYPGDAYVDWTCLDGYNWGSNPRAFGPGSSQRGWRSFDRLFRSSYRRIVRKIAPTKPMIIGEIASSDYGGSKAAWIRKMLAAIPARFPRIRGLLWFEKADSGMDWPLQGSEAAKRAFAHGIRRRAYAANTFAHIGAQPIRPPR